MKPLLRLLPLVPLFLPLAATADLETGLVAHYPLDGDATDVSVNGNDGTLVGPVAAPDRLGNPAGACSFDGVDDYIWAAADGLPTAERTTAFWFRTDVEDRPCMMGYGGGGFCGQSWFMNLYDGEYQASSHCGANLIVHPYQEPPTGRWIHWAVTTEPTGTRMYVDGCLVAVTPTFVQGTVTSGAQLGIGVDVDAHGVAPYVDGNVHYFAGLMDDVRIYDRALSWEEVKELAGLPPHLKAGGYWRFEEATGDSTYDASGLDNDGELVGAAGFTSSVCVGSVLGGTLTNDGALTLDGTTSAVVVRDAPTLRICEPLTIEAIVRSAPIDGAIVGKQLGGGTTNSFQLEMVGSNVKFNLSNLTEGEHAVSAPAPEAGKCFHVAGIWDGAMMRLFLNGREAAAAPFPGPIHYDDNPVLIGADDDGGGIPGNAFFEGTIDEVRLSPGVLSPEEFLTPTAAPPAPVSWQVTLLPPAPNPFNPMTTIAFDLAAAQPVTLAIYDARGRLVRHILDAESEPAGRHEATWDGRDADGVHVESGVFYCRLKTPTSVQTRPLVLLK